MAFKEPLKVALDRLGTSIFQCPQLQQKATVLVADRQWFATPLVPPLPPGFEIHRPDFVSCLCLLAATQSPGGSRAVVLLGVLIFQFLERVPKRFRMCP